MVSGRRGLAAGITCAGFWRGRAITIGPIAAMIKGSGYDRLPGVWPHPGCIVISCHLPAGGSPLAACCEGQSRSDGAWHTPAEVLRSPCFWVLY